jgi:hypothetical protein
MLIDEPGVDVGPLRPIAQQLRAVWPWVVSITEEWQRRILPSLNGEHLVLMQAGGLRSRRWLATLDETSGQLALPEVSLASGIGDADAFGAGSISIVNTIGSMLGSFGIYPPKQPSLSFLGDGWSLGTLPQTALKAEEGTLEGILATSERWNWIGYSKEQWKNFAAEDRKPSNNPARLLGFEQATGPLASAALIDFGGLSRLQNAWLGAWIDRAAVDDAGHLRIPPTSTGRRLDLTRGEIKEFLDCLDELGRLTSFSKATDQGETLSRSLYDWGPKGP